MKYATTIEDGEIDELVAALKARQPVLADVHANAEREVAARRKEGDR